MVATAASVETRVRVLRLLNIIATVLPVKEPRMFLGTEPDLIAVLWEEALRTRAVSSIGVRSAIERKCRSAKGEVDGVAGEEYVRFEVLERCWRAALAGRRWVVEGIFVNWVNCTSIEGNDTQGGRMKVFHSDA